MSLGLLLYSCEWCLTPTRDIPGFTGFAAIGEHTTPDDLHDHYVFRTEEDCLSSITACAVIDERFRDVAPRRVRSHHAFDWIISFGTLSRGAELASRLCVIYPDHRFPDAEDTAWLVDADDGAASTSPR
jgi:hypothetical protein